MRRGTLDEMVVQTIVRTTMVCLFFLEQETTQNTKNRREKRERGGDMRSLSQIAGGWGIFFYFEAQKRNEPQPERRASVGKVAEASDGM